MKSMPFKQNRNGLALTMGAIVAVAGPLLMTAPAFALTYGGGNSITYAPFQTTVTPEVSTIDAGATLRVSVQTALQGAATFTATQPVTLYLPGSVFTIFNEVGGTATSSGSATVEQPSQSNTSSSSSTSTQTFSSGTTWTDYYDVMAPTQLGTYTVGITDHSALAGYGGREGLYQVSTGSTLYSNPYLSWPTAQAGKTITVVADPSLSGNLSNGTSGVAYSAGLTISGGTGPYTVGITGLPKGLTFGISGGTITVSGTTLQSGSFPVTVTVKDADGVTAQNQYSLYFEGGAPTGQLPEVPFGGVIPLLGVLFTGAWMVRTRNGKR